MHSPIVAQSLPTFRRARFSTCSIRRWQGPRFLIFILNRTIQSLRHRHRLFLLGPGIRQAAGECRRGDGRAGVAGWGRRLAGQGRPIAPLGMEPASPHRHPAAPRRAPAAPAGRDAGGQLWLGFAAIDGGGEAWEYAFLVTSLASEILTIGQLDRDRARLREQLRRVEETMGRRRLHDARPQALPLDGRLRRAGVQLVEPARASRRPRSSSRGHSPAGPRCSRPSAGKPATPRRTTVTITSSHGEHHCARAALTRTTSFFTELRKTAEQLTALESWY
jgi:hypothetical protein